MQNTAWKLTVVVLLSLVRSPLSAYGVNQGCCLLAIRGHGAASAEPRTPEQPAVTHAFPLLHPTEPLRETVPGRGCMDLIALWSQDSLSTRHLPRMPWLSSLHLLIPPELPISDSPPPERFLRFEPSSSRALPPRNYC